MKLALMLLLVSGAAAAQTRPQDMPGDLWTGFKEQGSPEGLITLGATGALFAFARPQDKTVRAAVTGTPPIAPGLAHAGTWIGNAAVLLPAMGAVYGAGWGLENETARETGAMGLEALALAGLQAEVLKYAAERRRPDDSDRYSFPSGHAAESFALATVLASELGWEAGVPSCAVAGFVGYTRLQNNKHWLSDVAAGAGLGVLSGRAVVRGRRKAGRWTLAPWLSPDGTGLTASARF